MDKKQAKKILKIAVLVYLASFLIINWNDVSWIFNYQEVYGLVSDFFNPYPSIDASSISPYFYPNHSQEVAAVPVTSVAPGTPTTIVVQNNGNTTPIATSTQPAVTQIANVSTSYTDKQDTLEVPKISIAVPIVFADSTDKTALAKNLDQGVVYYPGSVYPGQTGQIVILGHSAPPGWPKIKHDWVFTDLDKLAVGDSIYIDLNNKQYTYTVKAKNIIKRGADVPADASAASSNVLTLISCWPPGKDYQRIAVTAELSN